MAMGIPARIFATLLRISPGRTRNWMWKWWYQRLAKAHGRSDFRFMNYGFIDDEGPELDEEDEVYRLFIQLYHQNIRDVDLSNKDVLEVGSGRGGGASWIAKYAKPKSLVAVDFSKSAVELANKWYASQKNLSFKEENAESLSMSDSIFDVVYNVESSHCYGNMEKFVNEVYRVLKPGGFFCWTDFRDKPTIKSVNSFFEGAKLKIISKKDITKEVLRALDDINDAKTKAIGEKVPRTMRKSFETFAGVEGTPVYEAFKAGTLHYYRYLLKKPE